MIRCHLSTLMGARKMKLTHVAEATGLHRNTLTSLYYERAQRIDLTALDRLCALFECEVGDLLEFVTDNASTT